MKRFGCLLFLLLLAACARAPRHVWTEPPTADALLQRVAETTGQVSSLDAAAKVSLTTGGKFVSSQQFLLVEKPDRLRVDALTGFGQLVLQLATDGQQLSVFTNTTVPGHFYQGPATAENLIRFTRIPLAAKDMVRLLLYDPPVIGADRRQVFAKDELLVLRLENSELQQEILFNQQLELVGSSYSSEGEVILEVLYDNILEEKRFPQTVRFDVAAETTQATIKFRELQVNVEIPPERFQLQKPANLKVETLP